MDREAQWLLEEKYNGIETEDFFTDCENLKNGVPLAYLIGSIPFLNTTIFLDSRPLIPRPETEFWVEKAIIEIKESGIASPKVLDLCAGSGCIGVAVLAAIPEALVDFVEIDTTHHQTIVKNILANNISKNRTNIYVSDLFEKINGVYDCILTNPPYIDAALKRTQESVLNNEPHVALFGGVNGLELVTQIISQAKQHLTQHGILYVEHEPEQKEAIAKMALEYDFTVVTHTDQYGVARYSRFGM